MLDCQTVCHLELEVDSGAEDCVEEGEGRHPRVVPIAHSCTHSFALQVQEELDLY